MISKQRMQALYSMYKSRYRHMDDSPMIEDRANAEACRLAMGAWHDISVQYGNPEFEGFTIEGVIQQVKTEWEAYLKTGIPENKTQMLADDAVVAIKAAHNARFGITIPVRPLMSATQTTVPDQLQALNTNSLPEFGSKGQKRRQRTPEQQAAISASPESEPESVKPIKIDQNMIDAINPRSIDEVIEVISNEFGLIKQEMEVASSMGSLDEYQAPSLIPPERHDAANV